MEHYNSYWFEMIYVNAPQRTKSSANTSIDRWLFSEWCDLTFVKNIFCKKGSILSLMILHRFKNSTCRMAAAPAAWCLPWSAAVAEQGENYYDSGLWSFMVIIWAKPIITQFVAKQIKMPLLSRTVCAGGLNPVAVEMCSWFFQDWATFTHCT